MSSEDKQQSTEKILQEIVNHFGKDIYANPQFAGYIADYMPFNKRLKLLKTAVDDGIARNLLKADSLTTAEKETRLIELKYRFREDNAMERDVADYIVDCFAYALGWKYSISDTKNENDDNANLTASLLKVTEDEKNYSLIRRIGTFFMRKEKLDVEQNISLITKKSKEKESNKTPDVYIAGYEGHVAKLWKNGVAQNISNARELFTGGGYVFVS